MKFYRRGVIKNFTALGEVEVLWQDGELSGDEIAVHAIQTRARVYEGREVGPPGGPYTTTCDTLTCA